MTNKSNSYNMIKASFNYETFLSHVCHILQAIDVQAYLPYISSIFIKKIMITYIF